MPEGSSTSPVRVLVFASGRVGRDLIDYLLAGPGTVRRIVVGSEHDRPILDAAAAVRIPAEVFTEATFRRLVEAGERVDWLLNLWSRHIVPPAVLALARRRLNIHPGLVPGCRGNDPAAWALRKRLPAGISLLEMDATVDTGGIYAERRVASDFPLRGRDLHERLQDEAIQLFIDAWPEIVASELSPRPQAGLANNHTRRMTNSDRRLDGSTVMTLKGFMAWALAHDFSPRTTAEVSLDGRRYRLTLNVDEIVDPPTRVDAPAKADARTPACPMTS